MLLYYKLFLTIFMVVERRRVYAIKNSKKSSTFTAIHKVLQDDVNKLKANKIKCTSTNKDAVIRLLCTKDLNEAILCMAEKILDGHSSNGKFWTILGQIYHRRNDLTKGNKCFKEAVKLSGKFGGHIPLWYFLGPFQIGKPEIDGDPTETFGGITTLYCQRHDQNFKIYSELMNNGEIKWTTIRPESNGVVTVSPKVDWQTLVMGLQSMAVTEWQGWLVGDVVVNSEMTILIQCLGVNTIFIDGNILVGDVYRRDQFWHPIQLKPGVRLVMLRARSKGEMLFSCNLKSPETAETFDVHTPLTPDLVDGHIFSDIISVPITNTSPTKWLKIAKVMLVRQDSGPAITFSLNKNLRSLSIAPGQVRPVILHFKYKDTISGPKCTTNKLSGVLRLGSSDGKYKDISFQIRCRKRSESFLFTFIDHDGSVQYAAAIFPILKKDEPSPQTYPVLLTLHGTSVPAQNQADSYKRMERGEWIFGVERLWILAATRHGAHNWEGPGELTSMTALTRLHELTMRHDWLGEKANSKAVVFAGHSMGGHGAWQLATHNADIALAVVSIAGWIKKENYGDSNVFFTHDISVSHVDSATKYVLEACISENDVDKHVSNLKGIPILIRVGANDNTVLPYYSRRMYRLLKGQGNNVTFTEITGKEHWWWDTYHTNDGGVVNDPDIRNFVIKHSKDHITKPTLEKACTTLGDEDSCENEGSSRYQSIPITNRNTAGSGKFTLTVYNPASSNSVRGVHILQQNTPFRKSVVEIMIADTTVTLETTNVARLRITEPGISPVSWQNKVIVVDGVSFAHGDELPPLFDLCLQDDGIWKECPADMTKFFENELNRGPLNLGPARRIAEKPLMIVIGASNEPKELRQLAIYIANLFYFTSDALVPVLLEKDVGSDTLRNTNVIVIGKMTPFISSFLERGPLRLENNSVQLGRCYFKSPDIGLLSLVPHSGSGLGLVLTGTSLAGVRDIVQLATPTIPPMTRSPFSNLIPDYVITGGAQFRAKGPGGYLCSGFWGNKWEYRADLSSCAC